MNYSPLLYQFQHRDQNALDDHHLLCSIIMKSTAMVPTVVSVLLFLLSAVAVASLGGVDASKAATSTVRCFVVCVCSPQQLQQPLTTLLGCSPCQVNAPCGPIVGTLTEEARVFRGYCSTYFHLM